MKNRVRRHTQLITDCPHFRFLMIQKAGRNERTFVPIAFLILAAGSVCADVRVVKSEFGRSLKISKFGAH